MGAAIEIIVAQIIGAIVAVIAGRWHTIDTDSVMASLLAVAVDRIETASHIGVIVGIVAGVVGSTVSLLARQGRTITRSDTSFARVGRRLHTTRLGAAHQGATTRGAGWTVNKATGTTGALSSHTISIDGTKRAVITGAVEINWRRAFIVAHTGEGKTRIVVDTNIVVTRDTSSVSVTSITDRAILLIGTEGAVG